LQISQVQLAKLSSAQIEAYIASGEPFGKAGAYGIQGRAGAFISSIQGSYSGIMGLPLYETAQLLSRAQVITL
jgi:septum formation protein